jgi:hypothetical protein
MHKSKEIVKYELQISKGFGSQTDKFIIKDKEYYTTILQKGVVCDYCNSDMAFFACKACFKRFYCHDDCKYKDFYSKHWLLCDMEFD